MMNASTSLLLLLLLLLLLRKELVGTVKNVIPTTFIIMLFILSFLLSPLFYNY